jgi:hypothetical protein
MRRVLPFILILSVCKLQAQITGYYGSDTNICATARDYLNDIEFDDNGNMFLTGRTDRTFPGDAEVYYFTPYIKFNQQGHVALSLRSTVAETFDIKETSDGNLVLCGTGNGLLCNTVCKKDMWIYKMDTQGNNLWGRSFGNLVNDGNDIAYDMTIDPNDNIIVAGEVYITGKDIRPFLCSLDQNGDTVWTRCYGASTGWQQGNCVTVSSGNNIYVGGSGQFSGPLIMKHYPNGDLWWAKAYSSGFGNVFGIYQLMNGSFNCVGDIVLGGVNHLCMFNIDPNGNVSWAKVITCSEANQKIFTEDTYRDASDNIYWTGYYYDGTSFTVYTPFLIKMDANGNLIWSKHYTDGDAKGKAIHPHPVQGLVWGAEFISNASPGLYSHQPEYWLIHLAEDGLTDCFSDLPLNIQNHTLTVYNKSFSRFNDYGTNDPMPDTAVHPIYKKQKCSSPFNNINEIEERFVNIYPNPSSDVVYLEMNSENIGAPYQVIDLLGRVHREGIVSNNHLRIDIADLSSGIYLLRLVGISNAYRFIKQ